MKKKLFFTSILITFCSISLFTQLRLDVEGDAKITGSLDIGSNSNTFVGVAAGQANTTGSNNTFFGRDAGQANTIGVNNTFVGTAAGQANTTGVQNTFVGLAAGVANTTGIFNTFVGNAAGSNNIMGNENTFVGTAAGQASTGNVNTFVGYFAGHGNTMGNENTFVGGAAGQFNTTGTLNTFLGRAAGYSNTTGKENTFVGVAAGQANTTGIQNTFVGNFAGKTNTTGNNNTFVGYNVQSLLPENGDTENVFTLGSNTLIRNSHSGVLGNIATQKIGGYVNWGTASDSRMKKNIKENIKGLDFILKLRPVSFQIDAQKLDKYLRTKVNVIANSKDTDISERELNRQDASKKEYQKYLAKKSKIRYTGFIAQEVEKIIEETKFEFSGLVKPSHNRDHYSLRYAEFVVPLVKGMQEQQELIKELERKAKETDKLKEQIQAQQRELNELKYLVEKLISNKENSPNNSYILQLQQKAILSQNHPNPFHENTIVNYFIPKDVQNAKIQITTVDGKIVDQVNIMEVGKGQVIIKNSFYSSGTYYYSLVLDGLVVETKRMVFNH